MAALGGTGSIGRYTADTGVLDLRTLYATGSTTLDDGSTLASVEGGRIIFFSQLKVYAPDIAFSFVGWFGNDTIIGGALADTAAGGSVALNRDTSLANVEGGTIRCG